MLKFDNLKQIHLEITNRCQAACPMCNRNVHGGLSNPLIKNTDWSIYDFKKILPVDLLKKLHGIYFCGNFGDPIINSELADMCEYAKSVSDDLELVIHTNGSARSAAWWNALPTKLPKNHRVVFALDGLSDTHSIYRIGTRFETIIKNATAFINSGGIAEWVFIKFKHNEHQLEEAKHLAQSLGFDRFTVKNSTRFIGEPKYPVFNSSGNTVYFLEPPSDNQVKFISYDVINNYREIVDNAEILCYAAQHNEIYIDAHKHVYPCCYIGSVPYTYTEKDPVESVRNHIQQQHLQYIDHFGGYLEIDATVNSIEQIMEAASWKTAWNKFWKSEKLIMCARVCGEIPQITGSQKQIIEISEIKRQGQ